MDVCTAGQRTMGDWIHVSEVPIMSIIYSFIYNMRYDMTIGPRDHRTTRPSDHAYLSYSQYISVISQFSHEPAYREPTRARGVMREAGPGRDRSMTAAASDTSVLINYIYIYKR